MDKSLGSIRGNNLRWNMIKLFLDFLFCKFPFFIMTVCLYDWNKFDFVSMWLDRWHISAHQVI